MKSFDGILKRPLVKVPFRVRLRNCSWLIRFLIRPSPTPIPELCSSSQPRFCSHYLTHLFLPMSTICPSYWNLLSLYAGWQVATPTTLTSSWQALERCQVNLTNLPLCSFNSLSKRLGTEDINRKPIDSELGCLRLTPFAETKAYSTLSNKSVCSSKLPTMVRASTLDGRTLSDVINAAHRASMNEKERRSRSLQLNQRGRFSPLEIQYDTNHHSSSSSISPAYSLDIRQNYNDRLGYESKSQPYYMSRAPSADDEAAYRRYPSY
ncbi:hypothetical protein BY996DRAFT_6612304 [Phakopsora pachyrhizi]|nr:hypothetical protein BY996DRAFT_6612304 [Phakopsora pachyrhizi]